MSGVVADDGAEPRPPLRQAPSGSPASAEADPPPSASASLADLWEEHYRDLVRLARLLVDDRGVAEELVQDAFISVHGRLHRVPPDKAPAYLRSAVLNAARSHLRHRQVRRRHEEAEAALVPRPNRWGAAADAVPPSVDQDHLRHDVLQALRVLPRRQREVLVLRYFLDLSERETADALGVSVGSVKTHAHRGLATLAPLLDGAR